MASPCADPCRAAIAVHMHLFEEITVMSLAADHAVVGALSNPIRGVR